MASKKSAATNKTAKKASKKPTANKAVKKISSKAPTKKIVKKASLKKAAINKAEVKKSVKSASKKPAVKSSTKKVTTKSSATKKKAAETKPSPKVGGISGSTFLFTGTLTGMQRKDAEAIVKANGGTILSGVSDKLNYLVVGEDAGSKLAKAKALKTIKILNEKEFAALVSGGNESGKVNSGEKNLKAVKKQVFKGENPLDVKIAKKSINDYVNFDEYDSIDAKAAAILAGQDSTLYLDGIKYMDVDAALALAQHEGENTLSLNGLLELDEDVARALSTHNGPLYLNCIRSLSPEAIKQLANCQFDISLDGLEELEDATGFVNHNAKLSLGGLKSISDAAADQLSKKKGEVELGYDFNATVTLLTPALVKLLLKCNPDRSLNIDSVENLSVESAMELAKHNESISLNGLKSISTEAARALAKSKFDITLNGLITLEDGSEFINHAARLSIRGIDIISDKLADQLCKKKGLIELNYDFESSIKSLTPSIARLLVKCCQDGPINLDNLEKFTPDSAKELAKHNGSVLLGLKDISNEILGILNKIELQIDNVSSLTAEQFKTVSTYKKGISLNGLQRIDKKEAEELVKVGTKLELIGLESISDDVARILASFKGILHLGCKKLSEKSAQYFGEAKRKAGKSELHLPEIKKPEDIEGKGLDYLLKDDVFVLRYYPELDFDAGRVIKICFALAGGEDYGLGWDPEWFEEVKADVVNGANNEEFATFREIAKCGIFAGSNLSKYFPDYLRRSEEFYFQLAEPKFPFRCDIPVEFIKYADDKIKENRELMLRFLELNQSIVALLEYLPAKLQNDKVFVLKAIEAAPKNFQFASPALRDDEDIINTLISVSDYSIEIEYASDRIKADHEIAKAVLSKSGRCLEYFNDKIKNDNVLVKIAVDNNADAIQYASQELLNNKEFLLTLNAIQLQYIPEKIISDKDFIVRAVENLYQYYLFTGDTLDSKSDELLVKAFIKLKLGKDVCKRLLMISDSIISELPKELKEDLEVAKILLAKDVSNMEYIPIGLQKNKDLKSFFENLEGEKFDKMSDEDLVLIAIYSGYGVVDYKNIKPFAVAVKSKDDAKRLVKKVKEAYAFLSDELKLDRKISELALEDPENAQYLPNGLLNHTEFIENILKKRGDILEYLPGTFKENKHVVMSALKQDVRCFEVIDQSLQKDKEIIDLVISIGKASELSCLEKLPDSIKENRDFAMRLAKKGYVLQNFRSDKEFVTLALSINSDADIGDYWNNDPVIAIMKSGDSLSDEILKKYPNIASMKLLEYIQLNATNGKSNSLLDWTERYMRITSILEELLEDEDNDEDSDNDDEDQYNDDDGESDED